MSDAGLLCVHAHPDDEALWTGGILARHADAGVRTGVVTCTWSEETRRVEELSRSLSILGAGEPRLLGYSDAGNPDSGAEGNGAFVAAPLDEAVGRLVAHIRDFRPGVVVTYDAYGGYGHPDHVQAHRVTLAAVEAAAYAQLYPDAGEPWRVRALYLVTVPRSVVLAEWQELFGGPPDPGQVLPGTPDEQVTTTVDVRPWVERKWRAFQAHESEAERGAGPAMFAGVPGEVRERLLGTEWYIRRDLAAPHPADLFADD
ncbi:PIG-L family deacetylase [Actinoallomurus purpureus]|uniref:PIG-L family deacetylase n=1 Tax=Actinoallomurus purpureus TaxID=478114 RepID=UPI002092E04A|nr:PIG-L family deacetylase [Actinoallomurus purpureus]MCO6007092.1 PIG-L family deacetylase [Actinoallomurus purpureus]